MAAQSCVGAAEVEGHLWLFSLSPAYHFGARLPFGQHVFCPKPSLCTLFSVTFLPALCHDSSCPDVLAGTEGQRSESIHEQQQQKMQGRTIA